MGTSLDALESRLFQGCLGYALLQFSTRDGACTTVAGGLGTQLGCGRVAGCVVEHFARRQVAVAWE